MLQKNWSELPAIGFRSEPEHIRPIFRRAIERWTDVWVTAEGPAMVDIRRLQPGMPQRPTALIVVGINRLNQTLFERCAAHYIGRFIEDGWIIKLLDFGFTPASAGATGEGGEPPAVVVAKALEHTERLRYVVFFTHSRQAINISDSGNDLVAEGDEGGPEPGSGPVVSIPIRQLRLSASAAPDGWVEIFGCMCRPRAQWARELAGALKWPVRTVYPGFGIYFPEGADQPRSAIPFTPRLFGGYCPHGWAVWLPGAARPVRVSEPGETVQRYDRGFYLLERLLVAVMSVGLERVRDFRKLRHLAHARQEAAQRERTKA